MIQVTPHMRIVVAVEPVDFRNGIDGLARICKEVLAFCFSQQARHSDQGTVLRRPRVLSDTKTLVVWKVLLLAWGRV